MFNLFENSNYSKQQNKKSWNIRFYYIEYTFFYKNQ